MQSLIDNSTAFYGAGTSAMRRQFKLRAGPYSGRKIVIYPSDPATIKFSYSDAPYSQWSTPEVITENSADYPCTGWLDPDGNIYLIYTVQNSLHLAFRKLTFTAGVWTVGAEITIYADKNNYFPSVFKDVNARVHVCWTCYDSATGLQTIRYKRSTSDGFLWGAGSADPGTALTEGSISCTCQVIYATLKAYCVYLDGNTRIAVRTLLDGASAWEEEMTLATGSFFNNRLSAAVSESGGLVGVAFESDSRLYYIECDGANWSTPYEVCAQSVSALLLIYNGAIPFVFYGVEIGSGQSELRYRSKNGTGFGAESIVAPEMSSFTTVYLYDHAATPHYQNRTSEAADTVAADVLTTTSHALIAGVDDALYLGADAPFANVNVVLPTAGVGGGVIWEYFAGAAWAAFTPTSGEFHFDESGKLIRLWSDSAHAPLDWQKTKLESWSRFWVRARVTEAFATPPIGSQITPCTTIVHLNN
ncbi:MAG: hypothetical protein WBP29_03015 [Candidatus Zixiibacteriota bacterium]